MSIAARNVPHYVLVNLIEASSDSENSQMDFVQLQSGKLMQSWTRTIQLMDIQLMVRTIWMSKLLPVDGQSVDGQADDQTMDEPEWSRKEDGRDSSILTQNDCWGQNRLRRNQCQKRRPRNFFPH
ncbi:hypothetical protein YC2023_040926 [Brassica napus]